MSRKNNMVLPRYLRQMKYGKTLKQSNMVFFRYQSQIEFNEDVTL